MKRLLFLLILFVSAYSYGQVFDVGIILGPMTTAEINAISSPDEGRFVYNSDTKSLWYYNGTYFAEVGSGGGGGGGGSEVNDLSTIVTWANVPDAFITQSSVTQHESALSILESQISDLGNYVNADAVNTFTASNTFSNILDSTGELRLNGDLYFNSMADAGDYSTLQKMGVDENGFFYFEPIEDSGGIDMHMDFTAITADRTLTFPDRNMNFSDALFRDPASPDQIWKFVKGTGDALDAAQGSYEDLANTVEIQTDADVTTDGFVTSISVTGTATKTIILERNGLPDLTTNFTDDGAGGGGDGNDYLTGVTESAGVLTFAVQNQTNPTYNLLGYLNTNNYWKQTNDGAGSGLDADLFDGLNSDAFLRADVEDTKSSGNLNFNDNVRIVMGGGSDAELYHNGTDNILNLKTGNLLVNDNASTRFTFNRGSGIFEVSGYLSSPFQSTNSLTGTSNANAFQTFLSAQNSFAAIDNTTGSTNYPTEFGQSFMVRGSTANRSFALWKANGDNANFYVGNYDSGLSDWKWNQLWHAGNDGDGSGLDADLMDGYGWGNIGTNVTPGTSQTHSLGTSSFLWLGAYMTRLYLNAPSTSYKDWYLDRQIAGNTLSIVVENTPNTGSYTTQYTFNDSGVPANPNDVITKEYLDTYFASGTFLPNIIQTGTAIYSYSTQEGRYRKSGDQVYFEIEIIVSSVTGSPSSANFEIDFGSLPYTTVDAVGFTPVAISNCRGLNLGINAGGNLTAHINNGSERIQFIYDSNIDGTQEGIAKANQFTGSTKQIYISGTFINN